MTDSEQRGAAVAQGAADVDTDQLLRALAEQVGDLTRVVTRQAQSLDRLVGRKGAGSSSGTDAPLLRELFALFTDADTCARSATSDREIAAFDMLRDRLGRLIAERNGSVVTPEVGDDFDVSVMEAADSRTAKTPDTAATVAEVIRPGLVIDGRSVRPAMVVVYTA